MNALQRWESPDVTAADLQAIPPEKWPGVPHDPASVGMEDLPEEYLAGRIVRMRFEKKLRGAPLPPPFGETEGEHPLQRIRRMRFVLETCL